MGTHAQQQQREPAAPMQGHDPTTKVRMVYCDPVVLMRHTTIPTSESAQRESVELARYFAASARGLVVIVDQPIPPPPMAAMRIYRRAILDLIHLESVSIIVPEAHAHGLGHFVVSSLLVQAMRMTRLAGKVNTSSSLHAACDWTATRLETHVDEIALARAAAALRP